MSWQVVQTRRFARVYKKLTQARLIADTDALMTAAWCEMLLGERPAELMQAPKADLYLLLEPDLPWIDDGTRRAWRTQWLAAFDQQLAPVQASAFAAAPP